MEHREGNYDVVILGGGLAGLTLTIQLKQLDPKIQIAVIERTPGPLPEGTFKVGESTVEIGAEYLGNVIGLKDHLKQFHHEKMGFRYFFDGNKKNIEQRLEFGGRCYPPTGSYQVDRGRLENCLRRHIEEIGADFCCPALVRDVSLSSSGQEHFVKILHEGRERTISSRWLVDASGRTGLLRRRLQLAKSVKHHCSSAWFRVSGKFSVSDWCSLPEWKTWEDERHSRWFSTNHLMGRGYWVWMIPISSGYTSIGIVADEKLHPSHKFSKLETSLNWLAENEPQCAELLLEREIADFRYIRNYSYSSSQVFSADRWALTGEAGVFLDPFYSPGSDFIALANCYIVDLVRRDLNGEAIGARSSLYNEVFLKIFGQTLTIYENQYELFGNPLVMPAKIVWDYAVYWSFVGPLFFERKLTDMRLLAESKDTLERMQRKNEEMQGFFREWSRSVPHRAVSGSLDFFTCRHLIELNRQLSKPPLGEFRDRLRSNVGLLELLAEEIQSFAKTTLERSPSEQSYGRTEELTGIFFHELRVSVYDGA